MSTQNSNNFPKGFAAAHTPQAEDDYASDWNNAGIFIDVLSNDLGGAAKSLYSIDQSDPLTAETIAQSALGTTITIVDGKIYYDPTTNPAFADLSAGQTVTDSFTYAMQLGNGTISTATVYVTVTGTNVAPVAVADTSSVKEDTNTPTQPNPVSGNVLANDTDANALDTHSVAAVNGQAANVGADVAGSYGTLRLNADGSYTYTLDNSKASAQALAEGQKAFDIFTYTNSDNHGGTGSTTLTITVFGTDDAPTVSAGPPSATLVEQGAGVPGVATSVVNLTTGDVDGAASYDTTGWTQLSPTTFKMDAIYGYVVLDTAANTLTYSLDDTRPATDELIQGQKVSDNFTVNVKESDGSLTAFTPVTFSITGADDAPTVSASVPSVTLVEQGTGVPGVATSVVNLTIGDVDGAASYDTTGWTQLSPTTFKMDAIYGYAVLDTAANTLIYTLDNSRPVTDGLTQDQQVSDNFTVNVKETDGSLNASTPVSFTILGTDDLNNIAPVLSDFSSVSYLGAPILVTTDANGIHSNSDAAFDFSFSPDGTSIAFSDLGSNLVPNDTNGSYDIFVKNLATGAITRVSTEINGGQTNGNSSIPVYSPDGSKLAFISLSTNLVPGDTNNTHQDIFADGQDVFVKDLTTGAITLVSSNANGVPGDHDSYGATFSPDGTEVAFYSLASNLDPVADAAVNYFSNGVDPDIFIKNLVTGAISLVAPDSNSGGWNYSGELPAFSPDGNVLLLDSSANLTAGSNFNEQVYTKDLTTGTFRLISSDANGVAGNGQSFESVFSPDGTKVAFMSTSSNLVSDDTNGTPDIFIKDLVTGAISRVSTDANGMQANSSSIGPVFSPDGTAVTFDSVATNLVPGDTNNVVDVFWKNLLTGDIARVSTTAAGLQANAGSSGLTAFTPDGTKIAFWSEANNLVPNDTNSGPNFFGSDVFVRPMLSASGAVIDNPLQQFLTTEDTFKFSDLNVGDVHSVSVVAQPGALGTLSATVTHDSTGTGTGGTVTWDYQVAESIVHGLSAPTTDAFTATVSDGQGGTASVALHIALLPHDLLV